MTAAQGLLATLVVMSLAAVLLRLVSPRAPVPYPVLLAVLGVAVGTTGWLPVGRVGSDAILLGFVPGLVFQAAMTLRVSALRRVLAPVAALATAGVGLTVAGVGALAHVALGLSWGDGILLGAILSPTDPIAVVALMRRVHAPGELVALLEGESLLNDGTGVAAFAAVVDAVAGGHASTAGSMARFALIVAGGAAIGAVAGFLGALLLAAFREVQTEILLTVAIAYGTYLAADLARVSGIVAVVAAGLVISGSSRRFPGLHGHGVHDFWAVLAFILNALLFLLIGSALPLRDVLAEAWPVVATFAFTVLTRLVVVQAVLAPLDPRGRRYPRRWRVVAVWGGMRGALAIALALAVAQRADVDHRVAVIAYGAALLSVAVQGGSVQRLATGVPAPG